MKTKIVFATGNIDKMKEIREILEGVGADILSMAQAGISMDIEEQTCMTESVMRHSFQIFLISI